MYFYLNLISRTTCSSLKYITRIKKNETYFFQKIRVLINKQNKTKKMYTGRSLDGDLLKKVDELNPCSEKKSKLHWSLYRL